MTEATAGAGVPSAEETEAASPEQREAIERQWDAKEFSVYPVTPIYPR